MIASEPTAAPGPSPAAVGTAGSSPGPGGPVTTLRGAGVDVDPRRAARWVVVACLVAVAIVAVILLVAGIQKNNQSDNLHEHGVPVAVTVIGCSGLLGGSGSNGAGYACKGTYTFDGQHYHQNIPGDSRLGVDTVIRGIVVPSDPRLLSTPALVAGQQSSWKVFIAPAVLFVVFVVLLAGLLVTERRRRRAPAYEEPR